MPLETMSLLWRMAVAVAVIAVGGGIIGAALGALYVATAP
jgi:hypothetical protein